MSAANMNSVPQSIIAPDAPISTEVPGQNAVPIPETGTKVGQSGQPEKNTELNSTRFSHLAKKEAALVKEREAFKKEMEAFKADQTEASKYKKAWEMVNEIAELQKVDEVAAMRKAGFSDNAIMNLLAQTQEQISPEEKAAKMARAEIDKFKAEQQLMRDEQDKKAMDLKKVEEDRTISKFKNDIDSFIKKSTSEYEYLNFYGEAAKDLVYETISTIMAEEGEMIGIDEAAKLVEDFYEEQDKAMNSLKKRSKYINPPAPPIEVAAPIPEKKQSHNRVESKNYVDNRVPVRNISSKAAPTSASLAPTNLSPEENKQRVLEKYMNSFKR